MIEAFWIGGSEEEWFITDLARYNYEEWLHRARNEFMLASWVCFVLWKSRFICLVCLIGCGFVHRLLGYCGCFLTIGYGFVINFGLCGVEGCWFWNKRWVWGLLCCCRFLELSLWSVLVYRRWCCAVRLCCRCNIRRFGSILSSCWSNVYSLWFGNQAYGWGILCWSGCLRLCSWAGVLSNRCLRCGIRCSC